MKPQLFPALKLTGLLGGLVIVWGCQGLAGGTSEGPGTVGAAASPASVEAPAAANEALSEEALPVTSEARSLPPQVEKVLELAYGGVTDDVILAYIESASSPFGLTADDILYLKDLGLSDEVIKAMINHLQESAPPAPVRDEAPDLPIAQPPQPSSSSAPMETRVEVSEARIAPPETEVTYNYFYSSLSPYGTWVEVPDYGRCWRPTVAVVQADWQPYFHRGRWLWSDSGWYWHSYYSWGWAPFHYGRWHRHHHHGWVWVPGTHWGPSWVTWRSSDAYWGWAPLPPEAHYVQGVGLHFRGSHVGFSFSFGLHSDYYSFVPAHHFYHHRVWEHRVPRRTVTNIYNNTTVINNYTVDSNNTVINRGVDVDRVAQATRSEIRKVSVREMTRDQVAVYKPDRLARSGDDLVVYRRPSGSQATTGAGSRAGQELRKSGFAPTSTRGDAVVQTQSRSADALPPLQPRVSGRAAALSGADRSSVSTSTTPSRGRVVRLEKPDRSLTAGASSGGAVPVVRGAPRERSDSEGAIASGEKRIESRRPAQLSQSSSLIRTPVNRGDTSGPKSTRPSSLLPSDLRGSSSTKPNAGIARGQYIVVNPRTLSRTPVRGEGTSTKGLSSLNSTRSSSISQGWRPLSNRSATPPPRIGSSSTAPVQRYTPSTAASSRTLNVTPSYPSRPRSGIQDSPSIQTAPSVRSRQEAVKPSTPSYSQRPASLQQTRPAYTPSVPRSPVQTPSPAVRYPTRPSGSARPSTLSSRPSSIPTPRAAPSYSAPARSSTPAPRYAPRPSSPSISSRSGFIQSTPSTQSASPPRSVSTQRGSSRSSATQLPSRPSRW